MTLDSNGCLDYGSILHELIHALGFTHMQNHAERDKYVTIHWENIDKIQYSNFQRVSAFEYDNFGTAYDFYSVMHYNEHAFTKNRYSTIVPKQKYIAWRGHFGNRKSISSGDASRINKMYRCYS